MKTGNTAWLTHAKIENEYYATPIILSTITSIIQLNGIVIDNYSFGVASDSETDIKLCF